MISCHYFYSTNESSSDWTIKSPSMMIGQQTEFNSNQFKLSCPSPPPLSYPPFCPLSISQRKGSKDTLNLWFHTMPLYFIYFHSISFNHTSSGGRYIVPVLFLFQVVEKKENKPCKRLDNSFIAILRKITLEWQHYLKYKTHTEPSRSGQISKNATA